MAQWILREQYESPGGVVRYDRCGDGPPLVLVHGTPFSSYVWRTIAPELAQRWTVYVYDLLGYGASEQREGQDVSIPAQARLLGELLQYWQLNEPSIVGHDFGGAITLRAHVLENCAFQAIALIDPVAIGSWGSPFFRLVREHGGVFRQIPAYMHRAMVAAYIRNATECPMSDEVIAPYVEPWLGPTGQDAFFRQIAQADQRFTQEIEPRYRDISRRVLIVWGEEDAWIPVARGTQLQEAIPGSALRTIPHAGHLVQEDAPALLVSYLIEFLSGQG